MTEALFDIIFRGDITAGSQLPQVKQNLMRLFKLDETKINGLFSGQAVVLKRGLDMETAEKYLRVLHQAGAQVQKITAGSFTPPAQRARPQPAAKKLSLAERLAAEEAAKESVKDDATITKAPVDSNIAEPSSGFTLAPVGSDLLEARETKQAEAEVVDVSGLSVRAQEGNLLDPSEQQQVVIADLPDVDFGVAEVGADLVNASERNVVPATEVALADWDIAAPGEDLGQIKRPAPPPAPDTSQITLQNDE